MIEIPFAAITLEELSFARTPSIEVSQSRYISVKVNYDLCIIFYFKHVCHVFGCPGSGPVDVTLCNCRTSDFVVRSHYEKRKIQV